MKRTFEENIQRAFLVICVSGMAVVLLTFVVGAIKSLL